MSKLIFGCLLAIFSWIPITLTAQYRVFDSNGDDVIPSSIVNLGTKAVGSQTDFIFSIRNLSPDILFIDNISLVGLGSHFSVIGASGQLIFSNQIAQFTIRYAPTSAGSHSALVQFLASSMEFHDFTIIGNTGSCSAPGTPTLTITQPTCLVATGTITVTVQNASDTYSFDNGTTFQAGNAKSGLATGIYQIKIKQSSGCISSATPTSIQEQPNIPDTPEIFTYQPTCSVSTGTVTVTIQNASDTYSFDNGATFQYSNSKSDLTNGSYQIKIKRNSGCISTATSAIIQPQPVSPDKPQVSITQPTCSLLTGSIVITVQNSNDTYSFDNGVTFQQSNTSTELSSKVYTVRIKNSLGCISPETLAIISEGSSPESPVVSTAQPTCSVATGTITVSIQNGNDIYSFDDGATFQLSNSKSGLISGTYKIKIKTGLGCISSATSVTVNAQPTSPAQPSLTLYLTHPEAPVLRSHSTSQVSGYQWYKNGKAITNSNHATLPIEANDASLYSVVVFSSAGCASLPSEGKSAVVTGNIDSSPLSSIRLFPNPVNESLLISDIKQTEQIKILSSTGVIQTVQSEWSELQRARVVSVAGLASGLYFLQIQSDEQHLILKFIKE